MCGLGLRHKYKFTFSCDICDIEYNANKRGHQDQDSALGIQSPDLTDLTLLRVLPPRLVRVLRLYTGHSTEFPGQGEKTQSNFPPARLKSEKAIRDFFKFHSSYKNFTIKL
jgi:hypothetical protein